MMNRNERKILASQTVAICEAGSYQAPSGKQVEIGSSLQKAKQGTRIYSPADFAGKDAWQMKGETHFEVRNETTFDALRRLSAHSKSHLACLNFASAKNPGGGFLNGSIAQEEALAFASGLYPCLLEAGEYYRRNRANRSTIYLDLAIFSPLVPFIRDDVGTLLEEPVIASVITAPAPNAGSVAQNEPERLHEIEPALRRRADLVLSIAAAEGVDELVLGAWGCGVFRNDPRMVAKVFYDLLKETGRFNNVFSQVIFAVWDRSPNAETYKAFAGTFN